MDKFVIKRPRNLVESFATPPVEATPNVESETHISSSSKSTITQKRSRDELIQKILLMILVFENRLIILMLLRDRVRKEYLLKGACQPAGQNFPEKQYGNEWRGFRAAWFKNNDWLEYSVVKDATFCLYCYLFKQPGKSAKHGGDAFSKIDFSHWKRAVDAFKEHVGGVGSTHNYARRQVEDFMNQRQSISHVFSSHDRKTEEAYRTRITVVLHVVRLLLMQGLAFHGHDESVTSKNRENFLEILNWYGKRVVSVGSVLNENAPENNQMTSSRIQKDLVRACAAEMMSNIISEIGDSYFSLLVDESRDKSIKEQMAVIVRFVNKKGQVIEIFLGVEHISDTSAPSLKAAIDSIFARYGLSISRLRGQGYDGTSNMRGQFHGLKTLIQKESPSAFYIHCFASQLQLVVVSVAKNILAVCDFFNYVSMMVNVVGASCKRRDALLQSHHEKIVEKLEKCVIFSGRGKHQETTIARPGDTRWGSHHITLVRLLSLWDSVLEILQYVCDDGNILEQRGTTSGLIEKMESFEFVFILHLMIRVLGMTNELSNALQQKDQNIVNAMELIVTVKDRLQHLRDNGWDAFLKEVEVFCGKKSILVSNMEDTIPIRGRSRREGQRVIFYHHFHAEIFLAIIDLITVEINNRFSETSTELLRCISCLDSRNSFAKFDRDMLIRLAEIYSDDFYSCDIVLLKDQLETYIFDMRRSFEFSSCHDLSSLAVKMVETRKHVIFPLVYRLIELALILPVATASVERAFSAMNIIKTELRNKISDEWLNDLMICYIEREIFADINDEVILQHFQNMQTRRFQLAPCYQSSSDRN